jgi:DNA-binding transcriptional ArsR family regulator
MPGKQKPTGAEDSLMFLLQHPLRKRLLKLYLEAHEMRSPKELAAPTNQHICSVSYHVRVLAEHGAVVLVAEEPRRGTVEHFYEATPLVDEVPWARTALGLGSDPA